jgi:hypothetical protein
MAVTLKARPGWSAYGREAVRLAGATGHSGRWIRSVMNQGVAWWWQRWSAPAFYLLMSYLVDEGYLLESRSERKVEGVVVTEFWYRATDKALAKEKT